MESAALQAQAGIDVGLLYPTIAKRLERIVRGGVRARDVVVEDACQVAWARLVGHRNRVAPEAALSWLTQTATHEALRLLRQEHRELSLEATVEASGGAAWEACAEDPAEWLQRRERLDDVRLLPKRQQRLLWLHALGLSYEEMAAHERCTRRTVERQLLRAKRTLRERPPE